MKSVDFHPTQPWILSTLHSGTANILDYQIKAVVKSFLATTVPVRTGKFIARKGWIVCGSDDKFIRVFDHDTTEEVKAFEAHEDFIRSFAVHPTLPYLLSGSDDKLIKVWDWEKDWTCAQVFDGHAHYVMQVVFDPNLDSLAFASASLDKTIKIWSLGASEPSSTLEGHSKGINCIDYLTGDDGKAFLTSGSDDKTAKVWDSGSRSCVQTLEGHAHNVSAVCFHPELRIIISGSEDGTVRIWDADTYRLQRTLSYELSRAWAIGYLTNSTRVAIGFDEGTIMVDLGCEESLGSLSNHGEAVQVNNSS